MTPQETITTASTGSARNGACLPVMLALGRGKNEAMA
jgi:ABC-type phosphate transport system permease subunit